MCSRIICNKPTHKAAEENSNLLFLNQLEFRICRAIHTKFDWLCILSTVRNFAFKFSSKHHMHMLLEMPTTFTVYTASSTSHDCLVKVGRINCTRMDLGLWLNGLVLWTSLFGKILGIYTLDFTWSSLEIIIYWLDFSERGSFLTFHQEHTTSIHHSPYGPWNRRFRTTWILPITVRWFEKLINICYTWTMIHVKFSL